jgi:lambda family phage tail tape measure protein
MAEDINLGGFKVNTEALDAAKEKLGSLKDGIPSAEEAINGLAESFMKIPGPVGLVIEGLAAVGAALVAAAMKMAEHLEQLDHLSESYGLTASQADLMGEAAKRAGGSLDGVEAMYAKVAKAAYNASDPLKGTGAAFAELGINIKDTNGQLKSASDITEDAIAVWENGAQTTADFAAMQQVLGKNFLEQLPAMEASMAAKKLANDLEERGIFISQESVDATKNYSAATLEAHGVMSSFGSQLVELIMPQLTALVEWFNKSAESGGIVSAAFDILAISMKSILLLVDETILGFEIVGHVLAGVGEVVEHVAAAFALLAKGNFSAAKEAITGIADVAKDMAKNIKDDIDGINKLGDATVAAGDKRTKQKAGKSPYDQGGGDTKNGITEDTKAPVDPYTNLINSLNKMLESTEHLSVAEKAETDIATIQAKVAKENADITAHNTEVKAAHTGVLKNLIADITDEEKATIRSTAAKVDQQNITNALTKDLEASTASVQKYVDGLNAQINKGKQTTDQIALQNEVEKIHAQTLQQELSLVGEGLAKEEAMAALRSKEIADVQAATAAHQKYVDAQNDWLHNGMQDYITSLGTMEQGLEKLTQTGLQGFTDQLTQLVTTGKANFKSLIASMLQDIAKLIIQLEVVKPLLGMLGMGGGGSAPFTDAQLSDEVMMNADGGVISGGVKMFADGGIVSTPTLFGMAGGQLGMMGESGPEAIVPLPNGRAIPVQMKGGNSSGGNVFGGHTYNIIINNPQDAQSTAQQVATQVKQAQMLADGRIASQLRPGGLLNPHTVTAF